MVVEPTNDQVEQVVGIAGCDANTARRYLRAKQCDPAQALNAIFEGEDITHAEQQNSTWDESAWHTDRDGSSLHPLGSSAAPTRGPSPAPSLGLQNAKNKSDEDLQRALAASQHDAGLPASYDFPAQTTGTVGPSGTESSAHFGPAAKPDYDMSQWALTTTSAATEIVPDVPIHLRQQGQHEPAWYPRLLKHLPDGDYTPNFVMIAHAISKAREAFLFRAHVRPDYGFHSDWWNGASIASDDGVIVHLGDNQAVDPDQDKHNEFIEEVQRLTAFLDAGARVYASIGALTQTSMIKNSDMRTGLPSGSLLELFLQSWVKAAKSKVCPGQQASVSRLFTTEIGTTNEQGMQTPELTLVDLETDTKEDQAHDLHELLDSLLWDTDPSETNPSDNYIEHPADVIAIRIQQKNPTNAKSGLRDVPGSLQLDKYLKDNVDVTREVRQGMMEGRRRIAKIETLEARLHMWQHPSKSIQLEAKQMLKHTLGHFSGENRRNVDKLDRTNNAELDDNQPEHYAHVAAELEKVIASIDDKLKRLAAEKERMRKAIAEMSKDPPPGLKFEKEFRYTLRGVATKPNITYVLRQKSGEELEADKSSDGTMQDGDSAIPSGMQWWRLDYNVTGPNAKITRDKIDHDTVLHAAEAEHNSVLLVYANDDANDTDVMDELPEPLQNFVQNDRIAFSQDVKKAEGSHNDPPPSYVDWGEINASNAIRSIERDDDQDSTHVNTDNDMVDHLAGDIPGYTHQSGHIPIGYDGGPEPGGRPATPVAEIHLGEEDLLTGSGSGVGGDVEMKERVHVSPLLPSASSAEGSSGSEDANMGGVGEEKPDHAVGGATHPLAPDGKET